MKDEDFLDLIITRLSIYIFFPLSAKKKIAGRCFDCFEP